MGRPRTAEPRDRQLNLSLTASELEHVQRRAAALGLRPVHFGRAMILEHSRQAAPIPRAVDQPLERLIHSQLVRLGNNLNQLLRHLHQSGREPLPADLAPLLADIRGLIARRLSDDR